MMASLVNCAQASPPFLAPAAGDAKGNSDGGLEVHLRRLDDPLTLHRYCFGDETLLGVGGYEGHEGQIEAPSHC